MLVNAFEEQVRRHGDRIAIKTGQEWLTYAELNRYANRVAGMIEKQCPTPGEIKTVGLLFEQGPDVIAAILGTLKAGKVYVPLSIDYPQARLSFILADSGCCLILTTARHREIAKKLGLDRGIPFIEIDQPGENIPLENRKREIESEKLAYIMYTSGSTGKPKGVMQTHRNTAYNIRQCTRMFSISGSDRMTLFSSFCHDASIPDIFGALHNGAVLYPFDIKNREENLELSELLTRERITIWHSVPSFYRYFSNTLTGKETFKDLRFVLLGGEAVRKHDVDILKQFFPYSVLVNIYGQTESTINSLNFISVKDPANDRVFLGKPLDEIEMFVVDEDGQPVEPFEIGEILVASDYVSPGYWGNDESTRKVFSEDEQFGKLYWTGDLGRFMDTGDIEFVGRKDSQVKIRGFRIEMEEIESLLLKLESIKEAVVTVNVDKKAEECLCAYLVPQPSLPKTGKDSAFSVSELRKYLSSYLPDYMIPSYFMQLEKFPLTHSGKVDRKALPLPKVETGKDYTPPRNQVEEKMSRIWQKVLGLEKIGIHDNFFEIGGNSLRIMRISSEVAKEFEIEINFMDFLKHTTIAEISAHLSANKIPSQRVKYPEISPDKENLYQTFPITDVQWAYLMGRSGQFEMGNVSTHSYMEFPTRWNIQRFNKCLDKVINRHPMMRTIILEEGQQQILQGELHYPIVVEDISGLDNEKQNLRIAKERERMSHYIFKLDQWPLFEIKGFKISEDVTFLCIGSDLIFADAFSRILIIRDLVELYLKPELELPEPEFTFRDYMIALEKMKESEIYQVDKRYWLDKLEDFPSAPALPLKCSPSQIKSPQFKRKTNLLEKSDWKKLKEVSRKHNITPSALLCAVYARTLADWCNQPKLAVNLTVFNRFPFHPQVNEIVGDFTSLILLGLEVNPHHTFMEFAREVQNAIFTGLEHRHYDGIEFIRELRKHHQMANKAIMPVVFTSGLFEEGQEEQDTQEPATSREELPPGDYDNVSQTSQVFLDNVVSQKNGRLWIAWNYVADIFESTVIDRMFEYYRLLLKTIIQGEEDVAFQLPQDHHHIIEAYNRTEEDIPSTTLSALFYEQVKQTPDHTAIEHGDMKLTYGELDKKSNQVAYFLRQQGIGRNDTVSVLTPRGIDTIINVIGIIKTGAAYVPIEPQYPQERIDFIVDHSQSKLLLEPGVYPEELPTGSPGQETGEVNLPDDMAYVIYTSGSTGKPKGVIITHQEVTNTIIDINRKFSVTDTDRIMGISSMCFDLSVYDVFGSFSVGAVLVIINDQRDVEHMLETLETKKITIWNSVPAIMEMVANHMDALKSSDEVETLYWSPSAFWLRKEDSIEIGGHTYRGVALRVFPRLYFLVQAGISLKDLVDRFPGENFHELKDFIWNLVKTKVLVSSLLSPYELFSPHTRIFNNKYGKEIRFIPEAYDNFKKKQLTRTCNEGKSRKALLDLGEKLPAPLRRRRSYRTYNQEKKISSTIFTTLLSVFKQTPDRGNTRYYYASAGGLYPIDIYIHIKENRIENMEQGLYYYNPAQHSLDMIAPRAVVTEADHYLRNQPIFSASAFSVFMVYNADVTMPVYKGMGYFYAGIDAGLMVDALTQVSEELGIGLCSIGEMNFEKIKPHFNLDKNQVFIHAVELGLKPDATAEAVYSEMYSKSGIDELPDSNEPEPTPGDEDTLYWCPGKNWRQGKDAVEIDGHIYKGAALSVIPRLYFLAQKGINRQWLESEFLPENSPEVKELVEGLIENQVLVNNLLTPNEIYRTQSKLFKNRYGKEILYLPEAYEKFKKNQLGRTYGTAEIKTVPLQGNEKLPPTLCRRRSYRCFDEDRSISFHEFSTLLAIFKQTWENDNIRYYYASAGGLYPIDIYLYIKENRVEDMNQGLYYYHPPTHTLRLVKEGVIVTENSHYSRNRSIFKSSAFSIFMVYNAQATMPMYGGMGYFYASIDTGIMVGTLTRVSEELEIGLCSIGNMDFRGISHHFNLDKDQVFIHAVELGLKPKQLPETGEVLPEILEIGEETSKDSENTVEIEKNRSLRLVLLSGDWIPLSLPGKIDEHFANADIISLGGATEGSIWSIYYPVKKVLEGWKSIPYGFPLANQQFYVLNYRMNLCPLGVQGELYIGGKGVAEGYIADEEKTQQAFIYHPELGRIYRTGDYGKLHPEGYIEFLGRKDQQVKIRGYRVELGEIESCLLEHSKVKRAVVIDKTDDLNRKYLCAYIVTEQEPEEKELRDFLSGKLPQYMVPTYFVKLESIPLTANGKVARKSLPEPSIDTAEIGSVYAPPETEIEKTIVAIFSKMFNLKQLGIDDNFFEIGINSVDIVKISNKLKETFEMTIPILKLFEHSTIRTFARYLSQEQRGQDAVVKPVKMDRKETMNEAKNRMRKRIREK